MGHNHGPAAGTPASESLATVRRAHVRRPELGFGIRADNETIGGIIRKPIFERLIALRLCGGGPDHANRNVFYELGVRQGIRPYSTVFTFAQDTRLPFDVAPLRGLLSKDIQSVVQRRELEDQNIVSVDMLVNSGRRRTGQSVVVMPAKRKRSANDVSHIFVAEAVREAETFLCHARAHLTTHWSRQ